MPYDNNLSFLSKDIINQFLECQRSDKICITIQVDKEGAGGMKRYIINSKIDSIKLESDQSGSAKAFNEYLSWVAKNYKAKHYAVVLLNHGGGLNQYGLDEFPVNQWIQIDSLRHCINNFNKIKGIEKIDLLFEQVCARGSLENFYEFKDLAYYTLASQDLVPAPGYYYANVFNEMNDLNINSGHQLADLIVKNERKDMFYSFTLIENSKWKKWFDLLDKYTKSLNTSDFKIDTEELRQISYGGELYFDFISLVRAIKTKHIHFNNEVLKEFTKSGLIRKLYRSDGYDADGNYNGISLCSPFTPKNSTMSIYSDDTYNRYIGALKAIRR
jgi:hypothetical protein